MMCDVQACEEKVVMHITELGGKEPSEIHLCQRHADEYIAKDSRLDTELRRWRTGPGGEPGSAAAVQSLVMVAVRWLRSMKAQETVAAVIALLHGEEPLTRWVAALVLAKIGRGSAEAKTALTETLQDTDTAVRDAALLALRTLE